jgi:hypothetical protein
MSSVLRSTVISALTVAAFPIVAYAHPGHDDHELTWEFTHLLEHPIATVTCGILLGTLVWSVVHFIQSRSRAASRNTARNAR